MFYNIIIIIYLFWWSVESQVESLKMKGAGAEIRMCFTASGTYHSFSYSFILASLPTAAMHNNIPR